MNRRWFLAACGAAAVAGCTDDEPAAPENGADDGEEDTDDTAGDDIDGADQNDGDDATDATGDDGDDTGDAPDDGDEPEDDTDDSSDGGSAQLGEVLQFTEAFAFDFEGTAEDGSIQGNGRVTANGSYWQIETDGEVMEMYYLDESVYWTQGEECYRMDGTEGDLDEEVGTDLEVPAEGELEDYPELEAVGRETIDGEEMYVYELSADEADLDDDVTYYVSVETGHLRRVVQEDMTMNFHSWGEVDPIEAPDMDCTDVSEQGG